MVPSAALTECRASLDALPRDLTPAELVALMAYAAPGAPRDQLLAARRSLRRLLKPLDRAEKALDLRAKACRTVEGALLRGMHESGTAYGAWPAATWVHAARPAGFYAANVLAVGHHLGRLGGADALAADVQPTHFARRLFGRAAVDRELQRVRCYLTSVGYGWASPQDATLSGALARLLVLAGRPELEALSFELVEGVYRQASGELRSAYFRIGRALHGLGILPRGLVSHLGQSRACDDVDPEWAQSCKRWLATSTLAPRTNRGVYHAALRAGRWLARYHPEVRSPADWTRELAVAYVAAVNSSVVGELNPPGSRQERRADKPLLPRSKAGLLAQLRIFFRDCQEWGWIARRFDPRRVLATPRAVKALISPDPRVIADDVWARLLWAGLNLMPEDLPARGRQGHARYGGLVYPFALVRALALTWLFAGLRSDELTRLRVGCVRWQSSDGGPAAAQTPREGATCLLDVPVHKTGESYAKPVDPLVGEAIAAWEAERPVQPLQVDSKTGEQVALLFCLRARPVAKAYLNQVLIPLLCRKGGTPLADVRGRITSHRARATIATQLYNAKEPMTLFELQAWLGHRSPASTQHYARITPTTLAKAYADANYFARNVRAIEVLIDQDAIKSAAAAKGVPWRYYDLGHGLCGYQFFEQCPHRMACPRCDFYNPKESSCGQLLEAKSGLLRLIQEVPLTEEERATVDGDLVALDRLVTRLVERPTPSGQTPRELSVCTRR